MHWRNYPTTAPRPFRPARYKVALAVRELELVQMLMHAHWLCIQENRPVTWLF